MNEKESLQHKKYLECIDKLNELQAFPVMNVHTHEELYKHRLLYTTNMCKKIGIEESDINKLNIIHITGTKGKGSTCAFLESILRHNGYKTGLFSSPHLVEVRERIKLEGSSLSYEKFQAYFSYCHNLLVEKWDQNDHFDRPTYFQILTCMMFYIFIKEKIDVAIIEVGIGGEYDQTNIIQKPIACGITSIGLDHCTILGNTLEEIAWQKSGIFKSDCVAFTVQSLTPSVLKVIKDRAAEKNALLCLASKIQNQSELNLGLKGAVQLENSSLAVAIATYFIDKTKTSSFDKNEWISHYLEKLSQEQIPILKPPPLNENFIKGLNSCKWPGRNQIIKSENNLCTYYLDGAHTVESISQFVDWYVDMKKSEHNNNEKTVLLFNYTGERDPRNFLKILMKIKFDAVAFSKLEAYPKNDTKHQNSDNLRKMPSAALDTDLKYTRLVETYAKLLEEETTMSDLSDQNQNIANCKIFENILEALNWLTNYSDEKLKSDFDLLKSTPQTTQTNHISPEPTKINVLITGSLYLVGLSLKVLNYKIN